MPTNVAIAPAPSEATSAARALERERRVGEDERAAGDGRDQRHLVAVGEQRVPLGVLAVDRVDEPGGLVAEPERGPDVVDRRAVVELERRLPLPARSRSAANSLTATFMR